MPTKSTNPKRTKLTVITSREMQHILSIKKLKVTIFLHFSLMITQMIFFFFFTEIIFRLMFCWVIQHYNQVWLSQLRWGEQAVCCPGVPVQDGDERLSSLKWLYRMEGKDLVLYETYWSLTPARAVWEELIITHSLRVWAHWSPLCLFSLSCLY